MSMVRDSCHNVFLCDPSRILGKSVTDRIKIKSSCDSPTPVIFTLRYYRPLHLKDCDASEYELAFIELCSRVSNLSRVFNLTVLYN